MQTKKCPNKGSEKAEKGILRRTILHQPSTAQEWTIVKLLQDLDLKFVHPWNVYIQNRRYLFDFLIVGNLVLECSISQSCPSKARAWLRTKAALIDLRFRALKLFSYSPPFTLMLLEGSYFSQNSLNSNLEPLYFTDKLLFSAAQLQSFLQKWKAQQKALSVLDWMKTPHFSPTRLTDERRGSDVEATELGCDQKRLTVRWDDIHTDFIILEMI